jgi:hypothetical protein
MWRAGCGRGFGHVRQTAKQMNKNPPLVSIPGNMESQQPNNTDTHDRIILKK